MPKMKAEEVESLISQQFLCRVAFRGETHPYIAPFQYVVIDGTLYFHFTDYGKKKNFFNQGTPVCVEIERYSPNLNECAFVVLNGKLKLVKDQAEKIKAIEKMATVGKEKLSPNFLVAHGFPEGSGWGDFAADKSLLIIRLDDVTEKNGLRLP
jgi:uncharacterized protein